jgi:hypothetical protein
VIIPFALPKADVCLQNSATSICQRVGRIFPDRVESVVKDFFDFVDKWVHHNVEPLVSFVDTTFETWLAKTDYPAHRKISLSETRGKLRAITENDVSIVQGNEKVKCFTKDESFPLFKASRTICSRSDEAKVVLGPYMKLFDKDLFARPQFIKTVPVADRPDYILKTLGQEGPFIITDYTAFESLYTPDLIMNVEIKYMERLFSNLPQGNVIVQLIKEIMATTNKLVFRDLNVQLKGRRMSGEMNTSSGNGFTNAMLIEYSAHRIGAEVSYVCEGDDAAAKFHGSQPNAKLFEEVGIRVKLESVDDICRASFCGNVFDPNDRNNVTDPRKFLVGFGWSNKRYVGSSPATKRALLRAKALSAAYQYPGCPVIQAFSHRLLTLTAGCDITKVCNNLGYWDRIKMYEAIKIERSKLYRPVGVGTRVLVSELYGLSIDDQLRLESFFEHADLLRPVVLPEDIIFDVSDDWRHCWQMYVTDSEFPPIICESFNDDWRMKTR